MKRKITRNIIGLWLGVLGIWRKVGMSFNTDLDVIFPVGGGKSK